MTISLEESRTATVIKNFIPMNKRCIAVTLNWYMITTFNSYIGLHQNEEFCAEIYAINKVKSHPTVWEKITANHIPNKELVSRLHKEFQPLNNKNLIKNLAKYMNKHMSTE